MWDKGIATNIIISTLLPATTGSGKLHKDLACFNLLLVFLENTILTHVRKIVNYVNAYNPLTDNSVEITKSLFYYEVFPVFFFFITIMVTGPWHEINFRLKLFRKNQANEYYWSQKRNEKNIVLWTNNSSFSHWMQCKSKKQIPRWDQS